MSDRTQRAIVLISLTCLLSACAGLQHPAFKKNKADRGGLLEAVRPPVKEPAAASGEVGVQQEAATTIKTTPTASPDYTNATDIVGPTFPVLKGESIKVNYHNLPLPAFINEVFGEQLKLSY